METFLIKALQLILAFAILVIIHEFGHYIFSRIFGVRVEKFYLFFNPWFTLFKYKPKQKGDLKDENRRATWRDTEYGIGWLPLGGYVKIAGMIDESMDKEQMKQPMKTWEFRAKPAYQRLLIMTAGVIFNFILAIIIYAGIAFHWGEEYIPFRNATFGMEFNDTAHRAGFQDGDIPLLADDKEINNPSDDMMKIIQASNVTVLRNNKDTVNITIPGGLMKDMVKDDPKGEKSMFMTYIMPIKIESAEKGMGAAEAGLLPGDQIVGANGKNAVSFTKFTEILSNNKGKTIPIDYVRNGSKNRVNVQISENGKLGIMLTPIDKIYDVKYVKYSFFESIPRGIELGVDKLSGYVSSMKLIFTKEGAQSIGGFGAIGSVFPDKWDWLSFWNITAFLSVILAFMNILPIPALDGGHVMFLLYEIITRRQPNEKFLEYAQMVGMAFLILLLLYANGNDIYRFIFK